MADKSADAVQKIISQLAKLDFQTDCLLSRDLMTSQRSLESTGLKRWRDSSEIALPKVCVALVCEEMSMDVGKTRTRSHINELDMIM